MFVTPGNHRVKSVNNHSECRAKAEVVISHKSIALLSRYILCVTFHLGLYRGGGR